MKRFALIIACSTAVLFASPVSLAACDYPPKVDIPNGGSATKDAMLEGQKVVKQYVADMEVYLECIVAEEKQALDATIDLAPEDEQQRSELLNKKYNAAVDEMERVAAAFNAEVQAFRARER